MKKINQTTLNIVANLLSFIVTAIISFYITPVVTENVGMEAYGLVGLANQFTSYMTIVTSALNSMASRFIIIEIHKKNYDEANKYFNSAIIANTFFAFVIMFGSIFFIPNLDRIINVSPELVHDAKLTFLFVFISFSFSLITSVFGMGYYAKDKLSTGAWRCVQAEVIRAVLLVTIFTYFDVRIQFTVVATLISSLYTAILSMYFTRKNIPNITINPRLFDFKKIVTLLKAGIWNSISKLSQILLHGLDILITNITIGGDIQGVVSVSKTFSSMITAVISSVSDAYLPKFLKTYTEDENKLQDEFFKSTKVLGFFSCIILGLFMGYCKSFYSIWLPEENSMMLTNITYVGLMTLCVSGPIYSMFSLYTVINRVRPQAIATLITSILSTATVFILLKTTNLGVYAIVGTSAVYGIVKILTYNIFYLKKYMKLNVLKCYGIVILNLVTLASIIVVNTFVQKLFVINNFFTLGASLVLALIIDVILYFLLRTSIEDKKAILCAVKNRLKK